MKLVDAYKREKRAAIRAMGAVAVLSIVAGFCMLAVPIYLFQVYDRVLTSRSIETLVAITAIITLVLVTYGLLDALRGILLARIATRFDARVSGLLLAGELAKPDGASSASLNQLASVRRLISSNVFPAIFDLPALFIFLFIVWLIHPLLGAVVLSGIVVLMALTLVGEVLIRNRVREAEEATLKAQETLSSHLRQHELVRALGLYSQSVRHWGRAQASALSAQLVVSARGGAVGSASRAARQLIQIAMICTGALLVISDYLTPGVIFATTVVASRALAPVEGLVAGWRQIKQGRLNLQKIEARIQRLVLSDRQTPLPRPSKRLVADRVTYVPSPGGQPILKGITGAIEAGKNVAIIGPSGAGKSTFARTLVGYLEPTAGQILLDGQDMRAWDPVTRGMHMGYLPQQVGFFDATVRENIARMRIEDDPALAVQAAQFVGVHNMVMRFPEGYDTMMGENNFQPSGGQKQLLGLARAYYGGPAFVVLDEPNASLDSDGEQILFRTLRNARSAGIASIVVTQRLSLLHHVDKVLVLKNGVVDAFGDPKDVMPDKFVRAVRDKAS